MISAQEEEEDKARLAKKGGQTNKLSRAQIRQETEKRDAIARGKAQQEQENTHLSKPLEENINRVAVDGEEARTVEEAISVLRYILTKYTSFFKHGDDVAVSTA